MEFKDSACKQGYDRYAARFIEADPADITRNAHAIHEGEVLRLIQTARDRKEAAERDLIDAVRKARSQGITWQVIGGLLGMRRQGAQSYYADHI